MSEYKYKADDPDHYAGQPITPEADRCIDKSTAWSALSVLGSLAVLYNVVSEARGFMAYGWYWLNEPKALVFALCAAVASYYTVGAVSAAKEQTGYLHTALQRGAPHQEVTVKQELVVAEVDKEPATGIEISDLLRQR